MSQLAVNMVQIELMEGEDTVDSVFVATRSQTEKNVREEVRGLVLQEIVTNKMVTPEHTGPSSHTQTQKSRRRNKHMGGKLRKFRKLHFV